MRSDSPAHLSAGKTESTQLTRTFDECQLQPRYRPKRNLHPVSDLHARRFSAEVKCSEIYNNDAVVLSGGDANHAPSPNAIPRLASVAWFAD